MAQSSGVTCGKDQSTGQLGLRLRRVLILFEDTRAKFPRFCAIAEDPTGAAILLEPVKARAPNRQRIILQMAPRISPTETTNQSTPKELPITPTSGTMSRLNDRGRFNAGMRTVLRNLMTSRILRKHLCDKSVRPRHRLQERTSLHFVMQKLAIMS